MAGRGSKEKGAKFERELAQYFTEKLGIDVSRSYFTRDPLMHQGEGAADLIGLPDLAVEAKRVEKFRIPETMAQAKRNAQRGEMPVVINRRNRMLTGDSYVIVDLDNFIKLYRAYGQKEGFIPSDILQALPPEELG